MKSKNLWILTKLAFTSTHAWVSASIWIFWLSCSIRRANLRMPSWWLTTRRTAITEWIPLKRTAFLKKLSPVSQLKKTTNWKELWAAKLETNVLCLIWFRKKLTRKTYRFKSCLKKWQSSCTAVTCNKPTCSITSSLKCLLSIQIYLSWPLKITCARTFTRQLTLLSLWQATKCTDKNTWWNCIKSWSSPPARATIRLDSTLIWLQLLMLTTQATRSTSSF